MVLSLTFSIGTTSLTVSSPSTPVVEIPNPVKTFKDTIAPGKEFLLSLLGTKVLMLS